jgi:hypothetical protein
LGERASAVGFLATVSRAKSSAGVDLSEATHIAFAYANVDRPDIADA